MRITGDELAMVSAGVAAVAVVAGVRNNKSTSNSSGQATEDSNETALQIARDEREAKRKDELIAYKRPIHLGQRLYQDPRHATG